MSNKIVRGMFSRDGWHTCKTAATGRGGLGPFGVPEKHLGMALTWPFCPQPSFTVLLSLKYGIPPLYISPSPTRWVRALVPTPSPGPASSSQPARFVSEESFKAPRRNWCSPLPLDRRDRRVLVLVTAARQPSLAPGVTPAAATAPPGRCWCPAALSASASGGTTAPGLGEPSVCP